MSRKLSLLAVVGPTASGKTELSLRIAQQYDGEVVAADSRTIYRGMDIGTAKPNTEERKQVQHHLLDIRNPDQVYSAAQFKVDAGSAIDEIQSRGKLPVLVGGSGLYLWAVLYDYQFPAGSSAQKRAELERLPLDELIERLRRADPERAESIDLNNPRRVIRALELVGQPRIAPKALEPTTQVLGLNPGMPELERRINIRTRKMFERGWVKEVQILLDKYDRISEPLNTLGYQEIISYLDGEHTLQEAENLINVHTRQLAKRQLTWFKRNPDIRWYESVEQALKEL